MNRFSKISFWIVRAGLFLTLLTPFLVLKNTVYLYLVGKVTFFQGLIELIFPFFLYLAFTDKKFRPKINTIFVALGIYFAALILSAIFGVNPGRSFWGYRDRMDGLFAIFHFVAFFIILAGMLKSRKDWVWFFNAIFFSGLAVTFDYIARLIGANISAGRFFLPRLEGILGNVIFFASFVLFQIFIAAILFFSTVSKRLKIFYGIGAALFVIAVFLSLTRGAILALVAGVIIAALWFGLRRGKTWKMGIAGGIILVGALGIFGWSIRNTEFVSARPALSRILTTSPFSGTGETRLLAWQAAWKGFISRPVFGWGYMNFYAAFDRNFSPALLRYSPNETWFDRAHNIVFENLATGGIVTTLAYLFLLGAALFAAFKKNDEADKSSAVCYRLAGLGIIVYFMQNLFSVDHFGSYLLFFIFLGFLSAETSRAESREIKLSGMGLVAIIVAAILGAYSIYNINYKTLSLSLGEFKAIKAASSGDINGATALYRETLAIETPYTSEAKISFARSIVSGIESGSFNAAEERDVLVVVKDELDDTTLKYGWNSAYDCYGMGRIFSELGKYEPAYFDEASEYFNHALELSPDRQQLYFGIGQLKELQNDISGAANAFKKMVDLDPSVAQSHWYVGMEYNKLGLLPAAADEIITAYKLGISFNGADDVKKVIAAMKYKNDLKDLPAVYNIWISWDPQNASIYAEVAALYAELGEKENARLAAEKAMSLDPSFVKEGEIFLKSLGK